MYTASSLFLRTLARAGITHVFCNWGSDHPALLEDLARQRAQAEGTVPRVVTCPNEMVALSAAQGYAQVTGRPAAVIIHVDVGTQALAGAIHNVDRGRAPVLIYAGASPFEEKGDAKGGRNEWIMWLQDVPDQSAIVRQYMRYTAQIPSAKSMAHTVHRALQIATSEPKGPVYLWARREVMEEEIDESFMCERPEIAKSLWPAVEPCALSPAVATRIASSLLTAEAPLILTSHAGQNPHAVPPLLLLSTLLAIPIIAITPSAVAAPFSHPFLLGTTYLQPGTHSPLLAEADVILVLDCITPWIPGPASDCVPRSDARIFIVDSGDPLQSSIGHWHFPAETLVRASAETALAQIIEGVRSLDAAAATIGEGVLGSRAVQDRAHTFAAEHMAWVRELERAEERFPEPDAKEGSQCVSVSNVLGTLRRAIRTHTKRVLVLNEGITSYPLVWSHLRPERPGSMVTSGGSSLGWALGAAVGASLGAEVRIAAAEDEDDDSEKATNSPTGSVDRWTQIGGGGGYDLVVNVVGDGSFLFGVPSAAFWMARKYQTPHLTIVLNNGGWKSPKLSAIGVHPNGHASRMPGPALTVGFGPLTESPDYAQIAVAASAGWAWGTRVEKGATREVLEEKVREAVRVVIEDRRCAVLECVVEEI